MLNALAGICLLACVMSSPLLADEARPSLSPELNNALAKIQAPNIAEHINRLASDEFAGRAPGTRGETLTIEYLAAQLAQYGLKPGNPDGTYFQKVPLVGYQSVPKIEIEVGGQKVALAFLDDFVHDRAALKPRASAKNAGVVFAGYGIVAPLYGWDDCKDVDVRNKLVIVLGGEPSLPQSFKGDTRTWFSKEFGDAKWEAYSTTDYHQVTDEVKPDWDLTGAPEDAKWLMIAGDLIAEQEQRPEWKPGSEFTRK